MLIKSTVSKVSVKECSEHDSNELNKDIANPEQRKEDMLDLTLQEAD